MLEQATLSQGSRHPQRTTIVTLSGGLVVGVAALVMLGWLVRVPWMVQIIPGATAMVFSNALCLFLLGIALILATVQRHWCKPVQTVIGMGVLLLGITVMAQYHFDLVLPLDLSMLHAWLNGNPGRMAPNTALAHALAGLTVILMAHARPGVVALPALIGAFAVGIMGITGLVGYRLHPELLYDWHIETRMALHTGAAFVLLGIGFIASVYQAQHLDEFFRQREDLRVGLLGGGLMVFVGLVGGLVAFALMQAQLESVLRNGLRLSFQSDHDLIAAEITSRVQATREFANRPGVQHELTRLRADPDNRAARQYIGIALSRHVSVESSGTRVFDARGQQIASAGLAMVGSARLVLPLPQLPGDVAIHWDGQAASLQITQPILDHDQRLGRIESYYTLPAITHMLQDVQVLGTSSEMQLCVRHDKAIRCLPMRLAPQRTELPLATRAGATLMARALSLKSGVGFDTDYRGERVIAVYGPIGDLGLGMVLKVDAAEIYAPLRQRFELTLLVIALIIGTGILLLRARLIPLVRRLALSEKRYRSLLEQAPEGIFVADLNGRYTEVNDAGCRLLGYTHAEIIGKTIIDFIPPADVERLMQSREQMLHGDIHTAEWTLRRKDGSFVPVEVSAKILPDGRWQGFVRDISERKRAIQALSDSEQRWQFALEGSRDGVWDWNLLTDEVFFSRQWKEMLGYAEHELADLLAEWDKRVHPEDKARTYADIEKHLKGEVPYYQNEHRVLCKDGTYKWILDRGMIVARDAAGKPTRMIGTHTDISERKRAEETIRELSLADELTGLRNRRGFFLLGESQLSLARRLGRIAVLYFADVDGLKQINDVFGHAQGDQSIADTASLLRAAFRETDLIARLGGDEFVVLSLEMPDVDATALLARFEAQLQEFNATGQRPYQLAMSVGIALHAMGSNESLTELLAKADSAMYLVKQQHHAKR